MVFWRQFHLLVIKTVRASLLSRFICFLVSTFLVASTVRLRFRKSISGHYFQTIRKLANNDFQYYREGFYNIQQYILAKRSIFSHVRSFTLIYGPFICLIIVLLSLFLLKILSFFRMLV